MKKGMAISGKDAAELMNFAAQGQLASLHRKK